MKIVLITGGFDPIHRGHLSYIRAAKSLGDVLVVGVNSDEWLIRKKKSYFMPFEERAAILRDIVGVDFVIGFDDSDNSAKNAINMARQSYPNDKIIFANGGDRTFKNIPEMDIDDSNIEFVFGVGGEDKKNSSSWILREWKNPKTERTWGYYRVLHEYAPKVKLKELTVNPGEELSMQKHEHRSEHWFVAEGKATVYTINDGARTLYGIYNTHNSLHIPRTMWHKLANETDEPLKIIEIQYGNECIEEDIERLHD